MPVYQNKKIKIGYETKTRTVTDYKEIKYPVGTRTVTKTVPNFEEEQVVVGYKYGPMPGAYTNDLDPNPIPDVTPQETVQPDPTGIVTETPVPPTETPDIHSSPSSPSINTEEYNSHMGRVLSSLGASSDDLGDLYNKSLLSFRNLGDGYWSVSAPGKIPGAKPTFRIDQGYSGTKYSTVGLAKTTGKELLEEAVGFGLGLDLGFAIVSNVIDYIWGEHKDEGLKSSDFLASTLVDSAIAGITGLAAAGLLAAGVAGLALAGVAVPAVMAVGAVAGLGFLGGIVADDTINNTTTKEDVANGIDAWKGVFDNISVIADVGSDRIAESYTKSKMESRIR